VDADAHGHRHRYANAHAVVHTNTDAHWLAYCHPHSLEHHPADANAHPYLDATPDQHRNRHTHRHADPQPNTLGDTDGPAHPDGHGDSNSYSDTCGFSGCVCVATCHRHRFANRRGNTVRDRTVVSEPHVQPNPNPSGHRDSYPSCDGDTHRVGLGYANADAHADHNSHHNAHAYLDPDGHAHSLVNRDPVANELADSEWHALEYTDAQRHEYAHTQRPTDSKFYSHANSNGERDTDPDTVLDADPHPFADHNPHEHAPVHPDTHTLSHCKPDGYAGCSRAPGDLFRNHYQPRWLRVLLRCPLSPDSNTHSGDR
jgi:hypothetical protein